MGFLKESGSGRNAYDEEQKKQTGAGGERQQDEMSSNGLMAPGKPRQNWKRCNFEKRCSNAGINTRSIQDENHHEVNTAEWKGQEVEGFREVEAAEEPWK